MKDYISFQKQWERGEKYNDLINNDLIIHWHMKNYKYDKMYLLYVIWLEKWQLYFQTFCLFCY